MYWKYVIKRVINGIVIYIILIFIFSALFNMQMEQTVRAQIDEVVKGEVMAQSTSGKWTPEQLMNWSKERKVYYTELYNLNKPVFERIVTRAVDTILFRYGKSTIIKSAFGERDVVKIIFETVPRTLLLFGTAAIIDVILGILIGIKKAQKPGKGFDKGTSIATMIVFGMPTWWIGMLMIMCIV
jgi:peptide/nickel transport system permease protein